MVRAPSRLVRIVPSLTDVALLLPALFLFLRLDGVRTLLADGDTGWHIRAGEWILDHGRVPRHDLFSFTMPDRTWFAWEWLSEIWMAWLNRHGGIEAVVFAALLALAVTFALLYRLLRARCGNVLIAIALTAVAAAGSSLHFLARPHLATLLFTVIFLMVLEARRPGWLWLLPPLTFLWTNLHGGFVFGLALIGAWAAGETLRGLLGGGIAPSRRYWLAMLASFAASFGNPYGWHLHAHIARYLAPGAWHFQHVDEFLSPSFHHPLAVFFEPALALAAAAAFWHAGKRRFHYVLLAAGSAHMALQSARNLPLFLIVCAPLVAIALEEWIAAAQARLPAALHRALEAFRHLAGRVGATDRLTQVPVLGLAASLALAAAMFSPAAAGKCRAEFDSRRFPVNATAELQKTASAARIFAHDQWGDYLIYRLYPQVRVFVDGRSDFYGSDFEQICLDVLNVRHDWEQKLGRYGVDTVLLPAEAPLAGALKQSGRWRVSWDDGVAIVFRRAGETVSGELAAASVPGNPQINQGAN